MNVVVFLFAAAKEAVGENQLEIELGDSSTLSELKFELLRRHPELKDICQQSAFSVDHAYATDDTVLNEGAEIGLIPPVSGG